MTPIGNRPQKPLIAFVCLYFSFHCTAGHLSLWPWRSFWQNYANSGATMICCFFCSNDLSPLFWRLSVTHQQPRLPSDQKFGVANCLPVSKVLNPKTWYWYKDSMRMRLKGFDQIKNKNYWGIYARFWSDYEKFSCENFKGADLSCDQGCARDGQELHLLNTTFTFFIFQARKMGKRRPGVAEDLMSSTADEWKAMLAAPEVFNFVNFWIYSNKVNFIKSDS